MPEMSPFMLGLHGGQFSRVLYNLSHHLTKLVIADIRALHPEPNR